MDSSTAQSPDGARQSSRSSRDLLRGLIFAGLGIGAAFKGNDYGIGNARNMGGGYFPALIGVLLTAFGVADIVRGLFSPAGGQIGKIAWRPPILLALGVVGFALFIDSYGLLAAIVVLVLCALLARSGLRLVESLAIVVVLCCIAGALFVYGMGAPASYLLPH
jgi:hypothetical protein